MLNAHLTSQRVVRLRCAPKDDAAALRLERRQAEGRSRALRCQSRVVRAPTHMQAEILRSPQRAPDQRPGPRHIAADPRRVHSLEHERLDQLDRGLAGAGQVSQTSSPKPAKRGANASKGKCDTSERT